jgi:hypothetical protein
VISLEGRNQRIGRHNGWLGNRALTTAGGAEAIPRKESQNLMLVLVGQLPPLSVAADVEPLLCNSATETASQAKAYICFCLVLL